MKKRILSCILALAIVSSLMPATTIPASAAAGAISVNVNDIYADGNAIILKAGETANYTNIFIDIGADGNLDDGETAIDLNGTGLFSSSPLTGDTSLGFDLSGKYIFGGSLNSQIDGSTKITMLSGIVAGIFGGGNNDVADIAGNTYITLSGGTTRLVRGGGAYGSVSGSTNILIDGATIDGTSAGVYGGGVCTGATVESTNVTVNSGTINGFICGGGDSSANVITSTNVIINGGTFKKAMGGGGLYSDVGADCHLTINGGTFIGGADIFGAGIDGGTIIGSTYVIINNGTSVGNVYGGGETTRVSQNTSIVVNNGSVNSVCGSGIYYGIGGNASISIHNGTVGSVQLGGSGGSAVSGSAIATITGGRVYNISKYLVTETSNLVITGGNITGTVDNTIESVTNGSVPVYKTAITIGNVGNNQTITSLGVTTSGGTPYSYGLTGILTDYNSTFYAYLPDGAITTQAAVNSTTYVNNPGIITNTSGTATGTLLIPTYAVSATTNAVQANGITAMATFGSSPYLAGATASVTITLSGSAIETGTHTVGLTSTSAKAGVITAPATVTKTVTAGAIQTDNFTFTFTIPANAVDDLVVTHTFLQAQSTAPTASAITVGKMAATQAKVDFTLGSALTGTWKVYDAQTGGSIVSGVTASADGTTLSLTHTSNIPAGTYYVSVTEAGKAESARLALTVGAYVAPAFAVSATTNAVQSNGVTATATFGSSPYAAGATASVTITLSGSAIATGTHTVGLTSTSAKAGVITSPAIVTKTVTAGATQADTFVFTFTMPANAVDDLVVTHTFLQAQSTAPTASAVTVGKTAATQAKVDFTLGLALTGTWKVYDAQTGGSIVSGVTASADGTTLSLTHASNIPASTYYVSVTEAGKAESARLALTVGAYVAPTYTITASALTVFASHTVGYTTVPAAQTVTIANTGNQVITLTQPAITNSSSNYNIGALSSTTLAVGGIVTFPVQPKTGLVVGSYSESINIAGSNSAATSVSAQFSVAAANNAGGGLSTAPAPTPTPIKDDKVDVIFNNDAEKAATAKVEEKDNVKTTTVTLDEAAVKENLDKMDKTDPNGNDKKVIIPVNNNSDVVVGELNGKTVKSMEEKKAVLEIKTENVSYTLPAADINIDDVSSQMGKQVELKDIKVSVRIADASSTTVAIVAASAKKNSYAVIVKPIEFEITCTNGTKTVNVSKFNSYVERTVAIPDGIDPSKITTGVVLNSDGTFSHVPTTIVVIGGKCYAKINSLTNSTYTVIWNPIAFKDVEKHWAKDYVNEIGSRLIDSGVGNGNFDPNKAITRAEFASMIVKALGLKGTDFTDKFSDVKKSDPYYKEIYIASEYGIIGGYSNGKFGSQDLITRQDAMTIISRAMKIAGINETLSDTDISNQLKIFKDSGDISSYAKQTTAVCIKYGIFSGNKGKLTPKDSFTRAESATVIIRVLKKSALI